MKNNFSEKNREIMHLFFQHSLILASMLTGETDPKKMMLKEDAVTYGEIEHLFDNNFKVTNILDVGDGEKVNISVVFENDVPFYFIQILDFISFDKIVRLAIPFYSLFISNVDKMIGLTDDESAAIEQEESSLFIEKIKNVFLAIGEVFETGENNQELNYEEIFVLDDKEIVISLSAGKGLILLARYKNQEKTSNIIN